MSNEHNEGLEAHVRRSLYRGRNPEFDDLSVISDELLRKRGQWTWERLHDAARRGALISAQIYRQELVAIQREAQRRLDADKPIADLPGGPHHFGGIK